MRTRNVYQTNCTKFRALAFQQRRHQALVALDPESQQLWEYTKLRKGTESQLWLRAAANEIGRLANGGGDVTKGSQTMFFIPHYDKPHIFALWLKISHIRKKRNAFASLLVVIELNIRAS